MIGREPAPSEALLFERCRSVHTFGMRTPITVFFLDREWRVVRVARAPSGRVLFCRRARRVIECHIGADVRVGDRLERAVAAPPSLYFPGCASRGR